MIIHYNTDLDQLRKLINPIINQPCWSARLGYGDELCLEIGKKIPESHPLLTNEFKGEWQFGSRCSDWQLENNQIILINSDSEYSDISAKLKMIENTNITDFSICHPDLILTIEFSNNYQLKVIPDLINTENKELPCWELFTPNNRILTLYPTFRWFDYPGDVFREEMLLQI